MHYSRRAFIGVLSVAASAAALWPAQQREPLPQFPTPPGPTPAEPPRNPKRETLILKANHDAIAKDVTRMSELVDELQKEFENNDSTKILSLDVLRKSEQIEKLAKQIKELVRS